METGFLEPPPAILQRMQTAQNHHDLDAFVHCFAPDYESEQPVHPGVAFIGRDQVRKNWAVIFSNVPDFRSELLHWQQRVRPYGRSGNGTERGGMAHPLTCGV